MGHDHPHAGPIRGNRLETRRRLKLTLALMGAYTVAEVVGGVVSNSLALLADAGHMLSDVAAVLISLVAMWMSERPPTAERTYGYYRTEIMAALINAVTLVVISVIIFMEAWRRLRSPPEVMGGVMFAIASGGLVSNLLSAWILTPGREENLNARGVWLHVITDALGSLGAIVSAILIWKLGWRYADPVASILIALLVIYSAWSLLQETLSVLMEAAPGHIDVDDVRLAIRQTEGVGEVHDLHVWTVSSGFESLSAHVVAAQNAHHQKLLGSIRAVLQERFGIHHVTIQVEGEEFDEPRPCVEPPCDSVDATGASKAG